MMQQAVNRVAAASVAGSARAGLGKQAAGKWVLAASKCSAERSLGAQGISLSPVAGGEAWPVWSVTDSHQVSCSSWSPAA